MQIVKTSFLADLVNANLIYAEAHKIFIPAQFKYWDGEMSDNEFAPLKLAHEDARNAFFALEDRATPEQIANLPF